MKSSKYLLIVSLLLLSLLVGYYVYYQGTTEINVLEIVLILLIVIIGIWSLYKGFLNYKEEKSGIPLEDEFSNMIKYKSGYLAYLGSMYMWLFIFLFKDMFPDIETMLGGGILLSALIGFILKFWVKQQLDAKQN